MKNKIWTFISIVMILRLGALHMNEFAVFIHGVRSASLTHLSLSGMRQIMEQKHEQITTG